MILFPYHTNSPTTNTIQNIFINLRAIKVRVITSNFNPFFFLKKKKEKWRIKEHQGFLALLVVDQVVVVDLLSVRDCKGGCVWRT